MCEAPNCVPEMHGESGVKLQGACTWEQCVLYVWEPPGQDSSVHTLRVVCRSRGSTQYDRASPGAQLARDGCLKVHVQIYHRHPLGRSAHFIFSWCISRVFSCPDSSGAPISCSRATW